MRDLHVLTVSEDGTRLLLADAGGEQFSLPVDQRLRASLRAESAREARSVAAAGVTMSPREIQAHVRAGASADDVAAMAGIPAERVLRFAAPVLDERAHMARRARTVLLRTDAMLELGTLDQVASQALAARGVEETAGWDAWRRDDGRWIVSCSWVEDHEEHSALWVLDASAGSATPMDDDARALAGMQPDTDAQRGPRLAVVPNAASGSEAAATDEAVDHDVYDQQGTLDDETPTGPIPTVHSDQTSAGSPGPAHPARRPQRPRTTEDERLPLSDLADNIDVVDRYAPPTRPVRDTVGRQRPAVPSWDEIMFGRRS